MRADRSPPLDGLGVLRAVIEAGSFVRAGETLGLTQSAVSRAVARLEERVGIRLFQRTARSIALTDEGLRFYESVAPHLAAIEDATLAAGDARAEVRGRLRVNVDEGTAQYLITPRVAPFLERHPGLQLELVVRDRMGDLVRDGFDMSVRFGKPTASTLRSRLLVRTRILTCASPAYIARHGAPTKPADVAKHPCIMMRDPATGSPFAWIYVRGRKTVPVNATGQLFVNGTGALLGACIGGHGIAQVLELYTRDLIASGTLVQLLPDWIDETYPLHAFWHGTQHVSAKVRAFLDFVVEATRSQSSRSGASAGSRAAASGSKRMMR